MDHDEQKVTEFLAAISHELRNPLQALSAAIALVKLGQNGPATVATMENQMEHIRRLLDDIQDLTLLGRGKLALRLELLDVRDLTARVVEATRSRIDGEKRALSLRVPPGPVLIRGDADRLQQVLANLIVNACKYSPRGSSVALTVQPGVEEVAFLVTDFGEGLTPDERERVFDMFEQGGERVGGRGGLGIGLTLVKQLVERHGGSVEVHSEGRGAGSTFTVRLPVANEAS
jgi:signal transduction histidine kinase